MKRLLELDARLSARLRVAERPGILRSCAAVLAHSGDSWFWWPGLILLWWRGDAFWRPWALRMLVCILILAAVVLVVKFAIRRRRPEGEWGAFYRATDPHSFPSGHAARTFLIAVLASGMGPGWLALVLWVWAPLVALARVAMGLHYLSDALAGALLGALSGGIALRIH
ncbi:MAG: phosphatase PAP2 family protein [Anaerolineales bacterium]